MADNDKAETEEEEEEYESDLDDAPLPAVRRRATASDDEEEEDDDDGRSSPQRKDGSDAESDGQGAAEAYDQDVYADEEEGYEECEEVYDVFEQGHGVDCGVATEAVAAPREVEGVKEGAEAEEEEAATAAREEEGKKESEPYAVPTTGTFYMHDDRFQEARGRGRGRMLSNRKLWNSKEEQAWVHDRFDEMNLYDYHNGNTRSPRGHIRRHGCGPGSRTRGVPSGNFRGTRSRTQYHDGNKNYIYVPKESHIDHDNTKNARRVSYDEGKNKAPRLPHAHYDDAANFDVVPKESRTYYNNARSHKNTPRVTRGRGSRCYQPRWRSTTGLSSEQNNKSQNHENASSNADLGKHQSQNSNYRPEQAVPIKQSFASNLNSASPPFYPCRPSDWELPIGQRGSAQPSRPFSSPNGMEHTSPAPQYGPLLRGRASVPSVGHDSLQAEASMKGMGSPALRSSSSSSNSPFPVATNQVVRDSVQPSHRVMQQWSVQSSTRSTPRMPTQMSSPQFGSCDNMSSSTQPTPTVLTADTEIRSPHGSNKITRLTVKGQHGDQGEECPSFLYGGGHVLGATGAMGLTLGDQGFHGSPALLPVMQFGGQHPGGPGAPSIGMALPGFVSQQHLGLGNSEMAWLPVMAGSPGDLGATYGSPYIAMDGNYYSRSSGQASSSVSPREPSASNASSQLKPPEITEVVNDELTHRQNKPRRYSEMNFGQ